MDGQLDYSCMASESLKTWVSRNPTLPPWDYSPCTTQTDEIVKKIEGIFSCYVPEDDEIQLVDEDEDKIDPEDQRTRIEKLKEILPDLALLWSIDSNLLDLAAEKLADGSRDYKWRIPLGDSGILNFFLDIFCQHDIRHKLKIHTLRLIGNSCADRDQNRERITVSEIYMPSIILQLRDTSLLPYVLPVLFNICVDYESAQILASKSFLTRDLINLISSPEFDRTQPFLDHVGRILALLVLQLEVEIEHAPDLTPVELLKFVADHESPVDLENFISLVNIAIAYLQHKKFQKLMLQTETNFYLISTILLDSYSRFDSQTTLEPNVQDNKSAKALIGMRTALIQILSDISVLPGFKEVCPISSRFSRTLLSWLLSPGPQLQLQVCASIVLGNLARFDSTCVEFVQDVKIHQILISILLKENSSQLLHSVLGFLKNLSIPLENKKILGQSDVFKALSRVWALDTMSEVRFISISLTRQLTIGTYESVRHLLQQVPCSTKLNISPLFMLFESTDDEPIKMEIARLTTSICRVLHSHTENVPDEIETIRQILYQLYQEISSQLSFVVSQKKWPVVRSEGWFVMALMARFSSAAAFVSRLLHHTTIFQSLLDLLTRKTEVENLSSTNTPLYSTPDQPGSSELEPESVRPDAQAADLLRLDRENALVLISEILKNSDDKMPITRRATFKELLKDGGKMLLKVSSTEDAKHI